MAINTFELVEITHPTKGRLLVRKGEEGKYEQARAGYSDMTVEELEALIPEGAEIEGSGAQGRVLKKDLVDFLEAK